MICTENIFEIVKGGRIKEIAGAVSEAIASGENANGILNAMIEAMAVIGEGFKTGEIFIPEMLVAAMTMQAGVAVLSMAFALADVPSRSSSPIRSSKNKRGMRTAIR